MLQTSKLEAAEAKLVAERNAASVSLDKEVGLLKDQLKSQLDSLQILVEEKSSLEKRLQESETLILQKEGMSLQGAQYTGILNMGLLGVD